MKVGDVIGGRFEIERFVARGGMGKVYRALDHRTGATVALKSVTTADADYARRFALEALALRTLDHPGIVRHVAHDAGVDLPDGGFIAMEWVDGTTLSVRLRAKPLSMLESLLLARAAAEALGAAHQQSMVHRDVTPRNILLVEGRLDRIKLLDFGLVRLCDRSSLTAPGMGMGTPGYMAPEQVRGAHDVAAPADVFSLGCVLFRCLTGAPPFRGDGADAVMAKTAMFDTPPRVSSLRPDVPLGVDELVASMMAQRPERRPAHGRDAAACIDEVLRALELGHAQVAPGLLPPALTTRELAPVAVLLADLAPGGRVAIPTYSAITAPVARDVSDALAALPALRRAVAPYGARLESLVNGSLVALVTGGAAATDLAARAARCARVIQAWLPEASIGIASGRGEAEEIAALGPLIDAAALLVRDRDRGIYLDEATRALVGDRFDVTVCAGAHRLGSERELMDRAAAPRRLLGRPTPCVGRDRVLRQLEALASGVFDAREAAAVVLVGDAGIGKSRVASELLKRLRASWPELGVLSASGDPMRADVPHRVVGRALSRYLGDEPEQALAQALPDEADAWIRELLVELLGSRPHDGGPALRAVRGDPGALARQVRRAWCAWVTREAARRPLLLLVDDLQWADASSVELLGEALRTAGDLPVFVVALARPEVRDRLPDLDRRWNRQEIVIDALRPSASAALVRAVLGNPDADMCRRIVELSAGNAFYLEELIRAAAADGDAALPDSVLASVQLRVGRVSERSRQVLRAASLFGRRAPRDGLHTLLGPEVSRAELSAAVAALAEQELLHELPGADAYAFAHDLVRDAAYAMLTPDDRRTGHRIAGQWLQSDGTVEPVVLAEHFMGGGAAGQAIEWFERAAAEAMTDADGKPRVDADDLRKAATYLRRAGDAAAATYDNRGALRLYERATALFDVLSPAEAAWTLLSMVEIKVRLAQSAAALEDLERAGALMHADAREPRLEIELLLRRAELLVNEAEPGALARARDAARNACEIATQRGLADAEARAWALLARVFSRYETDEDTERAVRYAERALAMQRDDAGVRRSMWRLGNAFLRRNRCERAEQLYLEALRAAEAAGDDACVADCLANLGLAAFRTWRIGSAIERSERAKRLYDRIGYRHFARNMLINLGTCHAYRGDRARARGLLEQALAESDGAWESQVAALELLAALDREVGDEASAQARFETCVRLCRQVGVRQREAVFLGLWAESLWSSGRFDEAVAALERAVTECERFTLSHALALVQVGSFEQAQPWLEQARRDEVDPDRRLIAQLALARLRARAGEADALSLCDEVFHVADAADVGKLAVAAATLSRCVRSNVNGAVARLKAAHQRCGAPMFAELVCDVGALLCEQVRPPVALVREYLELAEQARDRGLAYRIDELRARLYLRLGEATRAAELHASAHLAVDTMAAALPPAYRERFEQHPWVARARASATVVGDG